jgi:acetylornithine deacetylase/succinyl-diaminopimelate desuccinylase-like protein
MLRQVAPNPVAAGLQQEVVDLLRRLIRVDTTNPPGNETAAAELLRDYLEANGVECELYARVPERASVVARLRGRGDGPSLLLLSHTDVVLANEPDWEVPPFGGELRDGSIWGRGAIDMKSQVAASAVAIASLAREGFEPSGDLVFAATADEEVGDHYGLSWLCEEHPDAVRCDFAVNEGQGDRIALAGRVFYLCSTAEKPTAPFRVRVHGRSGHAALPSIADNALVGAARLIERLAAFRPEPELQQEVRAFLAALLDEEPPPEAALERAAEADPGAVPILEPLLGPTFSPTMITASEKGNVIPGLCEISVDCRLLPGQSQADAERLVRSQLGTGVDYELEWPEPVKGGTRSPLETPLWAAAQSFVDEVDAGARVVPICTAGFTDSHWLREAFGTVAYGFFPARTLAADEAARLVHSANERIPVADLELGLAFLRHAAREICA